MAVSPGVGLVLCAEEDVQDVRVAPGTCPGALALAEQTSALVPLLAPVAPMATSARVVAALPTLSK